MEVFTQLALRPLWSETVSVGGLFYDVTMTKEVEGTVYTISIKAAIVTSVSVESMIGSTPEA